MAFFNILIKKRIKDSGKWIILIGLCLISILQIYTLNVIFENTKKEYEATTYSNLTKTIKQFNITNTAEHSVFSYHYQSDSVYIMKSISKDTTIYIKEKLDGIALCCKGTYDIRNPDTWSLDSLGDLWKETFKGKTFVTPYSFTLIDSNKIVLNKHEYNIDKFAFWRFQFQIPLGFLEHHQLNAEFAYPIQDLWDKVWDKIVTLIILFLMLAVSMLHIFFQLQTEKISKEIKQKITYSLIHNQRSPITFIRLCLENIRRKNILPAEDQETLKECHKRANGQLEDMDYILSMTVNLYGLKASYQQCDLSEIINNLQHNHQTHTPEKEVIISIGQEINNLVNIDYTLIKGALDNIVENAIKYSGKHTLIQINCHSENKKIIISIADNGIGIPKGEQASIFNENYRVAEKQGSKKTKGYGLGLYYVKAAIEAHKGKIRVESDGQQNGTTFIIEIPHKKLRDGDRD